MDNHSIFECFIQFLNVLSIFLNVLYSFGKVIYPILYGVGVYNGTSIP